MAGGLGLTPVHQKDGEVGIPSPQSSLRPPHSRFVPRIPRLPRPVPSLAEGHDPAILIQYRFLVFFNLLVRLFNSLTFTLELLLTA